MKLLRYGLAIALVAIIALSVAGCAKNKEPIAATVNGKEITMAEVDERLSQLSGQHGDMFNGPEGEKMKVEFRQRILDQLVEMELILQEVEKQGIGASGKEIDAKVKELMQQLDLKDEAALKAALKQQNMSMAQFREEVAKRIKIEKLGEKKAKNMKVSDKDIKEYYEQNKAQFKGKDQILASHILVQKEEDAKRLLGEIKNGGDFAAIAKKNSIDPGSKDKGGEMDWTDKDQFVPEFSNAAWNLTPGQISEPVKTDYGYHIIKLLDKKTGTQKELKDVKKEINELLVEQRKQAMFTKWLEELKKKAKIVNYLEKEAATTKDAGKAAPKDTTKDTQPKK